MATRVSTRLTAAQGRRFGLTVGGAFLLLSALLWYRGSATIAVVLAGLGAALMLSGLVVPTRMGPIERAWMRMAEAISRVTVPLSMALIYFTVITPVGLLRNAISGDPLRHRGHDGTFWKSRRAGATRMERQF